jgi:hypothetical protein
MGVSLNSRYVRAADVADIVDVAKIVEVARIAPAGPLVPKLQRGGTWRCRLKI